MKSSPETFFIKTYGCQMNELDSGVIAGSLQKKGLVPSFEEKDADIVIFNTCSVRDLAERKVLGKLGKLGKKKKKQIIGVTGCMANAKKETLLQKMPHIDFVVGTNNIHEIGSIVDNLISKGERVSKTDGKFSHELDYEGALRPDNFKAHVAIIRGCNKHCTYCVVPYTRGPEVSRPTEDIINECKKLIDSGYKEITLLGQNVNSYGKDFKNSTFLFHDLLEQLDSINGLNRVRFLTSHPVDITRELMEAIRDLPSICEHVHFPIQAGSDRILRKMHRMYTKDEYFEKVNLLKSLVPNVALGTDIIVGFPTETEEEFEETCKALQDIEFANGFLYSYSVRKGTPATRWLDDVSEEEKARRLQRIQQVQAHITTQSMIKMIGSTVEILVERRNKDRDYLKGLTRCWRNVIFKGDDSLIGSVINIKIEGLSHNTFLAKTIEN